MFNPYGINNSFSLAKIISGLSKTLQIANQIIPLYGKVKPMVSHAQNAFKVLKEININKPKDEKVIEKPPIKKEEYKHSPTFFL